MKSGFIFLFLTLITLKTRAQEHVRFDSDNGLPDKIIESNRIKNVEVYSYKIKKNGIDSILKEADSFEYDIVGNMIEMYTPPTKKQSGSKQQFSYNNLNQIVKTASFSYDYYHKYNFAPSYEEFKYDKLGRVITKYGFNHDTTWLQVSKLGYNNQGKVDTVITKINKSAYLVDLVYHHDENKNLVKVDRFNEKKEVSYSYLISYDDVEHSKTTFLSNQSGLYLEEKIFYNSAQQIIKRLSNSNDNNSTDSNDSPNIVEKFFYNNDGTLNTHITYLNGKEDGIEKSFYKR